MSDNLLWQLLAVGAGVLALIGVLAYNESRHPQSPPPTPRVERVYRVWRKKRPS